MKARPWLIVLALDLGLTLAALWLPVRMAKATHADGGILFVKADGSGNACSQGQPCSLQTALAQAVDGDAIYLAAGTYTSSETAVISITKSISLSGGWDGSASMPPLRDPHSYPTTLDGEGQRRVVHVGGNITVTLEGLTVTNGAATEWGAGLYAQNAHLTLRCVTFYSNVVDSLSDVSTIGGGAAVWYGTLHVISSTFRANDASCTDCPRPQGGGLYINGALTTTIEDSLFEGNDAWFGSGLMFDGGGYAPILIRDTTFQDNGWGLTPGRGCGGYGGGAVIGGVTLAVIEDCSFLHNSAANDGGGLYFSGTGLVLQRSLIANNVAYAGPGLEIWNANPFTLTNNIIVDNRPGRNWAGGIAVRSRSTGWVLHNTIVRNVGKYGGYGVELRSGKPITLTNNILLSHTVGISVTAGNTATLEATLWGSGVWANGMDWGGEGVVFPGALNFWGDPAFIDPGAGDYHIGPGSPAIDTGVDAGVRIDFDYDPRPMGRGYDIGADEFNPLVPTHTPAVGPTATPSRTPSATPTVTPTRTASATPTVTPTPTRSPTPTATPIVTLSPTATLSPTRTPTSTSTPRWLYLHLPVVIKGHYQVIPVPLTNTNLIQSFTSSEKMKA